MKRLYATMVFVAICLMVWTAPLYAAPAVDGFAGVLWGASRDQVQSAMTAKGYVLMEEKKNSFWHYDRYKGAFAGLPAELMFYYEKNAFYRGSANILTVLNSNSRLGIEAYYNDIKKLIAAKYGSATTESELANGQDNWIGDMAKWSDLPAAADPPGQVTIYIRCSQSAIWDEIDQRASSGLCIDYSIGSAWARLKATGGSI